MLVPWATGDSLLIPILILTGSMISRLTELFRIYHKRLIPFHFNLPHSPQAHWFAISSNIVYRSCCPSYRWTLIITQKLHYSELHLLFDHLLSLSQKVFFLNYRHTGSSNTISFTVLPSQPYTNHNSNKNKCLSPFKNPPSNSPCFGCYIICTSLRGHKTSVTPVTTALSQAVWPWEGPPV